MVGLRTVVCPVSRCWLVVRSWVTNPYEPLFVLRIDQLLSRYALEIRVVFLVAASVAANTQIRIGTRCSKGQSGQVFVTRSPDKFGTIIRDDRCCPFFGRHNYDVCFCLFGFCFKFSVGLCVGISKSESLSSVSLHRLFSIV